MTTGIHSTEPSVRARRFPLGAFLLTLVGNVFLVALVPLAAAAALVTGVVVFAGDLLGLG